MHFIEFSCLSKQAKKCIPGWGQPISALALPTRTASPDPLFDNGTLRPYRYETRMFNCTSTSEKQRGEKTNEKVQTSQREEGHL